MRFMNVAQWAPVAVVTGAVIAGSVSGYTTRRTVRASAHSAHVTRQLDALDAFLSAVDAIAELELECDGSPTVWLDDEVMAVHASLRRLLMVVPPRLKEPCEELAATACSIRELPGTTSEHAVRELRRIAGEGILPARFEKLPEARQLRVSAALTALRAVEELHRAQDQDRNAGDHSALEREAREALRACGITEPMEQAPLLRYGTRASERLLRKRFEVRQIKLWHQRTELIAQVNAWINGTRHRFPRRRTA